MSGYAAILPLAIISLLSSINMAQADERMVPLAVSGDWIAMAHHTSMTAAADMCLVINSSSGVAIRSANEGIQFRVVNTNWTLPTGVEGQILLSIADWNATLEIDDNTDTMVNAELSDDLVIPMFAAMDKSTTMSVTVGKGNCSPYPGQPLLACLG
jgi:hypothetical protein